MVRWGAVRVRLTLAICVFFRLLGIPIVCQAIEVLEVSDLLSITHRDIVGHFGAPRYFRSQVPIVQFFIQFNHDIIFFTFE